ncbi:MAG: iron ABC transporter permease [Myxococcaceae bacterium]|nr:iron ABC transporter permease [Myxococcaceae bacterium]
MKRVFLFLALAAPIGAFILAPIGYWLTQALSTLSGARLPLPLGDMLFSPLWATVQTGVGSALLALFVGGTAAIFVERTDIFFKGFLRPAFTLPTAIPPYIWAVGWVALANPKTGYLNTLLGVTWFNVYSPGGIIGVLGSAAVPLVYLPTVAALRRIDPAWEEAARLSGAGPLAALLHVPVRLVWPAMASGAASAFLYAAASFGVPYLLGVAAQPPTVTLTMRVYTELLLGPTGLMTATLFCLPLFALAAVTTLGTQWVTQKGQVRWAAGKGLGRRVQPLGSLRPALAGVLGLAASVFFVLPLMAIVLASLQRVGGQVSQLTFAHWAEVLGNHRTIAALSQSALLGAGAALGVTVFGLLIALAAESFGACGRALKLVASWPYALPGTVLALALVLAFSRDIRFIFANRVAFVLALNGSVGLLLLAWVVKHLALGAQNASEALAQADRSLPEAARVCGATPWQAFFQGTFPQVAPRLGAAATLTFLICATELTLAVLLVPSGYDVLGTLIFEMQSYGDPASAAVLSSALVLVVAAVLTFVGALRRKERA